MKRSIPFWIDFDLTWNIPNWNGYVRILLSRDKNAEGGVPVGNACYCNSPTMTFNDLLAYGEPKSCSISTTAVEWPENVREDV